MSLSSESVTTFLGGFSAVPMGEKQDGSAKVETRFSHGVYFGVSGRMATSNSVDFGINSWVKQGLTAGFSSGAGLDRIFSFGMGVSAIY